MILDKLLGRAKGKEAPFAYTFGSYAIPPGWTMESYLKTYGQVGWLFGCVSRIAEAVSEAQWHTYQIRNGERKELDSHPLKALLNQVNPFQTGEELFELSQIYLDLVGECFWVLAYPQSGRGAPVEIWIAPPSRMRIVPDTKKFIAGYVYQWGTEMVPLETREVIFFKRPNPADPYRGIGPTQSIGVDLQSERFTAEWNRNFFYNDASPGLVISYPDQVTPDDYERLKGQWESKHLGVSRAHKVAILSGGAKLDRAQISQREMDLWRQRKINRDNILGAFGLPASIMGISESVNRANAEAGDYTFARWVTKPRLVRFREKINEQLCPLFGDNIEEDFDDPTPENRELKLQEAREGLMAGYLTINQARGLLGYDPEPSGNVFLLPATTIPIPAGKKELLVIPRMALPQVRVKLLETEEKRQIYWQQYVDKALDEERVMAETVRDLFEELGEKILSILPRAKKPTDALTPIKASVKEWKTALQPILEGIMSAAIADAVMLVKPSNPHTSALADIPGEALLWLMDRSAALVKGILQTTLDDLRMQLMDGFAAGEGMEMLADRVRGVIADCTTRRALLIARTETIAASAQGTIEGYRESGVVRNVEFFAALDERTCDECVGKHGETKGLYAGEAQGVIPVHPQCRCVWLPVIE